MPNDHLAQAAELDRSELLQAAYDEYCDRVDGGERVRPSRFVTGYPSIERSLRRLLDAHQALADHVLGTTVAWPSPGDTIGQFRLVENLGRGSFARVYLALDSTLGDRQVALKVSRQPSHEGPRLAKLDDDRIVAVLSRHQFSNGLHGLCMPYRGRLTLLDAIDLAFSGRGSRGSLDVAGVVHRPHVEFVLQVGIEVALALEHAHDRGVCHGDVKPSNILLGDDGRSRLIDFNLAMGVTDKAIVGGTLPYMSNARLTGVLAEQGDEAAAAGDVFALAVTLYEALTGDLPFPPEEDAVGVEAVAKSILAKQRAGAAPVRSRNSHVDRRLATTLESVIGEGRPIGAREFADELWKCRGPWSRIDRLVRRHRRVAASIAVAGLCVVASIGSYFASLPPAEDRWMAQGTSLLAESPADALQRFDWILARQPTHPGARRGRALALLGVDDAKTAYSVLATLEVDKEDLELRRAFAYCVAEVDHHNERAIDQFEMLLADGDDSASTLNNLGYCEIQFSRLDDAERHLIVAADRDPSLPNVAYNLAALERARAVTENRPPDAALARRASDVAPSSAANVHLDTAATIALISRRAMPSARRPLVDEALHYAELAVNAGLDGGRLGLLERLDPELSSETRFQELSARKSNGLAVDLPHLVNPVSRDR